MSKKIIIELRDVWKIYQMGEVQVNALRGLNLKIHDGEFIAIQGPSGSGKSTLMNIVGCLDIPSKGTVLLQNSDISQMSESNLATIRGKKIGFIFQTFNLLQGLTALGNVMLPMVFQGRAVQEREKTAKNLLKLVGLGERMYHRPSELSGGQRQRVAIARSLANNPPVVLADEPTGNLDSESGKSIIAYLKKLNRKEKKTIVIVTHDDKLAKHTDRIVHILDGRVKKDVRR